MTQPDATPLIQLPMLEPSAANQNARNIGTPKGSHAPASGIGTALGSFGLVPVVTSFHRPGAPLAPVFVSKVSTSQDQHFSLHVVQHMYLIARTSALIHLPVINDEDEAPAHTNTQPSRPVSPGK